MGKTIKKKYDRYSLSFKTQAIKLADHPDITATAVADSLGIHPVMLYRWRMEKKNGTLRDGHHMRIKETPKIKTKRQSNPLVEKDAQLLKATKRIKELEKSLAARQEELDILKKARRFFSKTKR